jgi:hypothetical protein
VRETVQAERGGPYLKRARSRCAKSVPSGAASLCLSPMDAARATSEREPTIVSGGCEDSVRQTWGRSGGATKPEKPSLWSKSVGWTATKTADDLRGASWWRTPLKYCRGILSLRRERIPFSQADPLWRKIRKPEASKVFVAKTREEKPVHLYPIEADHTPLPHRSKGRSDRIPGEAEPGLQGGEEFHTSACRKGREMGFVGCFFIGLSPRWPASPIPLKPASLAAKPSRRTPPPSVAAGWRPVI